MNFKRIKTKVQVGSRFNWNEVGQILENGGDTWIELYMFPGVRFYVFNDNRGLNKVE